MPCSSSRRSCAFRARASSTARVWRPGRLAPSLMGKHARARAYGWPTSREFNHRIKSVSQATFTADEVQSLVDGGNAVSDLGAWRATADTARYSHLLLMEARVRAACVCVCVCVLARTHAVAALSPIRNARPSTCQHGR